MISWVLNLIGSGIAAVTRLAGVAVFIIGMIWGLTSLFVSVPIGAIILIATVFVTAILFRFADNVE